MSVATDLIQGLTAINAEIEQLNTRDRGKSGAVKRLAELYQRAVTIRNRIDAECPSAWEDAPEPYQPAYIGREWFAYAKRQADARNSRRRMLKLRHGILKDRLAGKLPLEHADVKVGRGSRKETDLEAFKRTRLELTALVEEARGLGPFENYGYDPLSRTILATLAGHHRDQAEAVRDRREECIECGNLAQEGKTHCRDCAASEHTEAKDEVAEFLELLEDDDLLQPWEKAKLVETEMIEGFGIQPLWIQDRENPDSETGPVAEDEISI